MSERDIRGGERKWKRWGAIPPDVRQASLILWRTSAKGNKWLEYKGRHVVVYQVEVKEYFNGVPVYETVWRYSVNNNQRQKDFTTEAEAQNAALIEIGAIKGPVTPGEEAPAKLSPNQSSDPEASPAPLDLPDGSRRIKG